MDLARDARALVLAHRLGVVGAVAQARQRVAQLARALGDARLQLGVRAPEQRLGALALADVDEADDSADDAAAVEDRVARVLGVERRAVGTPEDLVVDAARPAAAEGVEDRAVALGVVAAVGVRVVHELVHVASEHGFGAVAEQPQPRRVHEGAAAVEVDAEDAFADAGEQQRVVGSGVDARSAGAVHARPRTQTSCRRRGWL